MNSSQTITLRVPVELKQRLGLQANIQGVSVNHLASYLLNHELTQIESVKTLHERLEKKSLGGLKRKVNLILAKVKSRKVPDWDRVD